MKRKITYLLKDFDEMIKKTLLHSKDFKSQVEFIKNKQEIFKDIDRMLVKYDKIIEKINIEEENEE